jgi:hypothetical protein
MRSRYTVLALTAYAVLALAVTYPLPLQLTTHIAGWAGSDSLEFIWSIWWFKRALFELHTNPLYISVVNHPDGLYFPLLPAMSQPFLFALPLALLTSPAVAFNFTILISFPLCAIAGYWLCYDLTLDRRAAFVGGLIWGFFPNKSGHALAGHLFQLLVFTLPIAVLFFLRMLRQPSARSAVIAGAALAVTATIHPVNVAYFLLPVLTVILAFGLWPQAGSGWRAWAAGSPLRWVLLAGAVAAGLALPLFLPTLLDRERLGFLVDRGVVIFSLDLLSFVLPAPLHPWVAQSPLADLARRVAPYENENIGYIGLVPLALTALGLRWRWKESRPWWALGLVTAVLSLGPVLHIGREIVRITVEDDRFPLLMPYAFLGQLPFFQWSRTPARLNETTLFAVAILASLGTAALLSRLKNARAALAVWIAACVIIPLEYLVWWPMPTAPLPDQAALAALAGDPSFDGLMNYPTPDYTANMITLYQQTIHQHPMVGGRVFRDQPGTWTLHEFLGRSITAAGGDQDIAPGPSLEQRAAAFDYFNIGRIVYQPANDAGGSARAALDSLFGAPLYEDGSIAVYPIPVPPAAAAGTNSYFVFGENWHPPEQWQQPTRWFFGRATLYLFNAIEQAGSIRFTAIPGRDLRRLTVNVNGAPAARFGAGDWAEYQTSLVTLRPGLNTIEWVDEGGSWSYVGDPRCQGGSAVAGPFPFSLPCDPGSREARELSLAIQEVRIVPGSIVYSPKTVFGGSLELLDAARPGQARPGDSITVHFTWRATQPMRQDLTMYVHLADDEGTLIAGNDSPPARGGFPTTQWQPGQIVKYNVPLALPADTLPGTYTLHVGWYVWPSLDPVLLPDGQGDFALGSIQLMP